MKKSLTILLALVLLCFGLFVPSQNKSNAEESNIISINMGNKTEVEKNFAAYFVKRFGSPVRKEEIDWHWKFGNNTLSRVNDIFLNNETENIASLCYQSVQTQDFEMSIDYKLGGMNYTWAAVAIRQQVPGKYYLEESGGGGVFVQDNGKVTLWGPAFGSVVIERNFVGSGKYEPYIWHTLKIRAVGTNLTVWLDGVQQFVHSMSSSSMVIGFVTLMAVNNDASFRNFVFEDLTQNSSIGTELPAKPLQGFDLESIAQEID